MPAIDDISSLRQWLDHAWTKPSQAVSDWPKQIPSWAPHLRLGRALVDAMDGSPYQPGPADLVTLMRSVIRYQAVRGAATSICVPSSVVARATTDQWRAAHVDIQRAGHVAYLRASPWQPAWLPQTATVSIEDPLYAPQPRRDDTPVCGDPVLSRIGLNTYRSAAQRECVRTVFCAVPGSTVVVNLPTGSGKSLCAFLPAMADGASGDLRLGVTPIVVPTVALALDLERRLREIVGHPVAYSVDRRDEADEIRRRVASGNQGPLLASPESLVGSLHESLHRAAKLGYIRHFVVDEAHMVTAWGDEFRPAFQQIPGVRRGLLRTSVTNPFVTILMSATFTDYVLHAMAEMFPPAGAGEFRVAHAVRLRPEPSYWCAKAVSSAERRDWILEAVRHLPRPVIVYALQREDVRTWAEVFRSEGFCRVGMMRGDTDDQERRSILQAWNEDRLDIIVATSAFGLGVDKSDVRAVIHAALPEGLDRLYQDVGRGGRDGRASLSLVVWTGQDWRPAAAVAAPTFIGIDRGRQRWRAMFLDEGRQILGSDRYALRVTVPPSSAMHDIDMNSEENEKWNRRTLTLMARAGLLAIEGRVSNEDDASSSGVMVVRVLRGELDRHELWQSFVEPRRAELAESYRLNLHRLSEMLAGKQCIARILQECYTSKDFGVSVVRACGGCPACRRSGQRLPTGRLRLRHTPSTPPPPRPLLEPIKSWSAGSAICPLYYKGGSIQDGRLLAFVRWLISGGFCNVVVEPEQSEFWRDTLISMQSHDVTFLHDHMPTDVTRRQPTLAIVQAAGSLWTELWRTYGPSDARDSQTVETGSRLVVALPLDIRDPSRVQRSVRHLLHGPTLENWEEDYLI